MSVGMGGGSSSNYRQSGPMGWDWAGEGFSRFLNMFGLPPGVRSAYRPQLGTKRNTASSGTGVSSPYNLSSWNQVGGGSATGSGLYQGDVSDITNIGLDGRTGRDYNNRFNWGPDQFPNQQWYWNGPSSQYGQFGDPMDQYGGYGPYPFGGTNPPPPPPVPDMPDYGDQGDWEWEHPEIERTDFDDYKLNIEDLMFQDFESDLPTWQEFPALERLAPEGFDKLQNAIQTSINLPIDQQEQQALTMFGAEAARRGLGDDPAFFKLRSETITDPANTQRRLGAAEATQQRYGLEAAEKSDINQLETSRGQIRNQFQLDRGQLDLARTALKNNFETGKYSMDTNRTLGMNNLKLQDTSMYNNLTSGYYNSMMQAWLQLLMAWLGAGGQQWGEGGGSGNSFKFNFGLGGGGGGGYYGGGGGGGGGGG